MKGFYDDCLRTKLADTCDWVISRAVYHDWCSAEIAGATAKFLWINAPAGFGKTVLCASLVQHFDMSSADPLAYFFFSAAAEARNNPLSSVGRGSLSLSPTTEMLSSWPTSARPIRTPTSPRRARFGTSSQPLSARCPSAPLSSTALTSRRKLAISGSSFWLS